MANLQKHKTPMPELDPKKRAKLWDEVALGYTEEDAINEAKRCLQCRNRPCVAGCPVKVKIPEFISEAADGRFLSAYKIISETNALPAVCGRVCPQETQCEAKCVRGIKGESVGIGRLERFCADYAAKHLLGKHKADTLNYADDGADEKGIEKNGIKVAIIGSGPAGLTCAGELARRGYSVTVFEALHTAGGVLMYGIPEFRLPKEIVQREIDGLKALGVEIITDMVIGRILSVDELFEDGYKAVFIGSGAGLPSFLGIPGEGSNGVYSANEYLTRVNLMKAYDESYDTPIRKSGKVAVIGGGNVAMDAARCALRLGADEVSIIYRRGESEMPARAEELHHAKEEGVILRTLTNPKEINADENGNVVSLTCVKMELGEPDESGRCRPVEVAGSEHEIEADTVIMAIGTAPNPLLRMTTDGLETDKHGCLIVREESTATTREGVFAGGDAVSGAATVILAMGAGKQAADEIDKYIKAK